MRNKYLSWIIALFLIPMLMPSMKASAQSHWLTNVDGRQITSLDGQWPIIVDPYETGYYNYRYKPDPNGFFKDAQPSSPSDLIEYRFDSERYLEVPGDWNTQKEKLKLYEGTIWYKKAFNYQLPKGHRLFVYFGAVNYDAHVYLNGEKLGHHVGGFTPFFYEITDKLNADDVNDLILKVDNKRKASGVPTLNTDWWNYGGITRHVVLVEVPETFITDYKLQLNPDNASEAKGYVQLDGPAAAGQKVNIKIPELDVATTVTTDDSGRAPLSIDMPEYQPWSPEHPKQYKVEWSSANDTVSEAIGFRTLQTDGPRILLNGEPIFLKGISIHEEAPFNKGRVTTREEAHMLLKWAKEMGANYVRLAHYPHNEFTVREAEKMGLMVWSEIPVYWTIQWENEDTYQLAEQQLREMINRDKNRAAVALWSVSNETPLSDARLSFLTRLVKTARGMDNTRLMTAAMERHYIDDNTLMIDDPFGEYLDVLGCNEYIGWYDGPPEKADRLQWKTTYDKPLIMSELGGGALYNKHGQPNERWTEEYQASIYRHQTGMLKRIPFLSGMSPWILMDFRSPRRLLPHIQDFWNRKGLISQFGQKKQAYGILQDFYMNWNPDWATD